MAIIKHFSLDLQLTLWIISQWIESITLLRSIDCFFYADIFLAVKRALFQVKNHIVLTHSFQFPVARSLPFPWMTICYPVTLNLIRLARSNASKIALLDLIPRSHVCSYKHWRPTWVSIWNNTREITDNCQGRFSLKRYSADEIFSGIEALSKCWK